MHRMYYISMQRWRQQSFCYYEDQQNDETIMRESSALAYRRMFIILARPTTSPQPLSAQFLHLSSLNSTLNILFALQIILVHWLQRTEQFEVFLRKLYFTFTV